MTTSMKTSKSWKCIRAFQQNPCWSVLSEVEDNKENNSRWTNWKELSPLRPDSVIVWKAKWWLSICHLGKLRHQRTQWLTSWVITTATFAERLVMSWHKSQICLLANNSVGSLSHRSEKQIWFACIFKLSLNASHKHWWRFPHVHYRCHVIVVTVS